MMVSALPRSLAATCGIDVSFSSSGYLDVSVPRVPSRTLWIHVRVHEVFSCGLPHSEICGSMPICGSPQLIAACRVLRRLPVPRHPPCALLRLTMRPSLFMTFLLCGPSKLLLTKSLHDQLFDELSSVSPDRPPVSPGCLSIRYL